MISADTGEQRRCSPGGEQFEQVALPHRNDYFSLTQIASRVSCLRCWWLWAAIMRGNDMTALVMSSGKYLRTYYSPVPSTRPQRAFIPPPSAMHKRATGHGQQVQQECPEPPAFSWHSSAFRAPRDLLAHKKKVQSSKQSCSCHQITCNCKFSSWQFWT